MNQRFWSSVPTVLLTTVLGLSFAPIHQQPLMAQQINKRSGVTKQNINTGASSTILSREQTKLTQASIPTSGANESAIAKVNVHEIAGSPAAILYVRSIPVLTFTNQTQAQQVATRINQLNANKFDADRISVSWNASSNSFTIKVDGEALVNIDKETRLAGSTTKLAVDALQATNRLRRLMGSAPPLAAIPGMPQKVQSARNNQPQRQAPQTAQRRVLPQATGIASWYGAGFHGRRSASGEVYNQNALTAAHRRLPFGTRVRVTNLRNNRSVVVRINDRGPFIRGRVIDLSAAAARILGLTTTGVAPVQLEVVEPQQATASAQ